MSKDITDELFAVPREAVRNRLAMHMRPVQRRTVVQFSDADNNDDPKRSLPPIKAANALMAQPLARPPEVIKGVLHQRSLMLYGGSSKSFKTFTLMDLALSVSSGKPWWGFETTKGRVLYIDFELDEWATIDRLHDISHAKGAEVEERRNLDIWNLRGHAADLSCLVEPILEMAKGKNYCLIIFDPLYKLLGDRDENAAGDINSLMNELNRIAVQTGAAVVAGHHFAKGNASAKESMDRFSGSGVFGRAVDTLVTITKHETKDAFTVDFTLRNLKPVEPFCIVWEFPLMSRHDGLNPDDLKKAGASVEKFAASLLLEAFEGGKELTFAEWRNWIKEKHGMSDRTFGSKKSELLKAAPCPVRHLPNGKWSMATNVELQSEQGQKQTANAAIASFAAKQVQ